MFDIFNQEFTSIYSQIVYIYIYIVEEYSYRFSCKTISRDMELILNFSQRNLLYF